MVKWLCLSHYIFWRILFNLFFLSESDTIGMSGIGLIGLSYESKFGYPGHISSFHLAVNWSWLTINWQTVSARIDEWVTSNHRIVLGALKWQKIISFYFNDAVALISVIFSFLIDFVWLLPIIKAVPHWAISFIDFGFSVPRAFISPPTSLFYNKVTWRCIVWPQRDRGWSNTNT